MNSPQVTPQSPAIELPPAPAGAKELAEIANLVARNDLAAFEPIAVEQGATLLQLKSFEDGGTLLHYAVAKNAKDIVPWLIMHGADLNVRDQKDFTPLHICARVNSVDSAHALLRKGADMFAREKELLRTPVHMACYCGSHGVLAAMLEKNGDPMDTDRNGQNALHIAAQRKQFPCVDVLIKSGKVDIHVRDKFNQTALHKGAWAGSKDIVDLLARQGMHPLLYN